MRHQITKDAHRVGIRLENIGRDGEILYRQFTKYGGKACSSPEYRTLESVSARLLTDGIELELKGHETIPLSLDEAENCLDSIVQRILEGEKRAA